MKIGFPVQKKDHVEMLDAFHGSNWIGSYDIKSNKMEYVSFAEIAMKSERDDLFSVLKGLGIGIVICDKMKPMALKYFNENRITVYKSQGNSIQLNIDLLLDGQLSRYLPQMAEASSCSSSCSSCSSESCGTS